MKTLFTTLLLIATTSSFANDRAAYASQREACFDEVSVQVSIGLSQAYHAAEAGSPEERRAQTRMENFSDYVSMVSAMPTACFEDTDTEDERLDCMISTYTREIKNIVKKYNAVDILNSTEACELLVLEMSRN